MQPRHIVVLIGLVAAALLVVSGALIGTRGVPATTSNASTTVSSAPSTTIGMTPDGCINGLAPAAAAQCQAFATQEDQQSATLYPASGAVIPMSQAIADATDSNATGATVYAAQMTFAEASTYIEAGSPNPSLSPTMPVYMITVHLATPQQNTLTPSPAYDTTYSYFSELENAITGDGIVSCDGCDIVQPDGSLVSALG
jgi:hypothetical protein